MTIETKTIQAPGCRIHVLETKKYKTTTMIMKLRAPLEKETVTMRALLPHVLQSGTESAPSAAAFRSALDELYGAVFFADSAKKGNEHVWTFTMEIPNERYLSGTEGLFDEALSLFADVLFRPKTKNGVFPDKTVKQEKRSLTQRIRSVYDDKSRYASARLVETMYQNDPYGLPAGGVLEDVEPITADSLFEYYKQALADNSIDVFIIGDVQAEEAAQKVTAHFPFQERPAAAVTSDPGAVSGDVKTIREEQDIQQGKLHIGLRTPVTFTHQDFAAMQVCNGVLGGFAHSKLFLNVREKESLAYYAASRYDSQKGFMMMVAGIDPVHFDKTTAIMKEQLDDMKNGRISDLEMSQTKALLTNQLQESMDTARGMTELLYHAISSGVNRSVPAWIDEIQQVTAEDVTRVAGTIAFDTVYFLAGKGEEQ